MEMNQGNNNLSEDTRSSGLSMKSWTICDVTKRIFDQFTNLSKSNSDNCQICSQKFQVVNNQMTITKCEIVKDTLNAVLQSLLVPTKQRKASNHGSSGVLLSICYECYVELKNLKDNILRLENLRIQFESFRTKIGRKIVMSSTGNSKEAFKCWQNKLNKVKHIYPSCLYCQLTATDDDSLNILTSGERRSNTNADSSSSQIRQLEREPVTCSASKDSTENSSKGVKEKGLSSEKDMEKKILENTLKVTKDDRFDSVAIYKSLQPSECAIEDITVHVKRISEKVDSCSNNNNNTLGDNRQDCDVPSKDDCNAFAEMKEYSIKQEIKEENDDESFDIIADPNEVDKLFSEGDLITKMSTGLEQNTESNDYLDEENKENVFYIEDDDIKCEGVEDTAHSEEFVQDDFCSDSNMIEETNTNEKEGQFSKDSDYVQFAGANSPLKRKETIQVIELDSSSDRDEFNNQTKTKKPKPLTNNNANNPPKVPIGPRLMFQCKRCPNSYMLRSALRTHFREVHIDYEYGCPQCAMYFKSKQEYNDHKGIVHKDWAHRKWKEEDQKCKICGNNFFFSVAFRRNHMASQHGILLDDCDLINCTHCDLVFNVKKIFNSHKLNVHKVGCKEQNFQCEICLKFLSAKKGLRDHKRIMHGIEKDSKTPIGQIYKCFLCSGSVEYDKAEDLLKHEETEEHKKEVLSRISVHCNVCRMNFDGNADALSIHLKGEEHKKQLAELGDFESNKFCVPCRQHFDSFEELKKHEDVAFSHQKICADFRDTNKDLQELETPLSCPICSRTFTYQVLLDRHMRRFHPLMGHKCKICKETFANFSELSFHKRQEHFKKAQKNFVCEKCGKNFVRQYQLSFHSRLYHDDQEIKCDECGQLCNSRLALKAHTRQKHSIRGSFDEMRVLECLYCERKFKPPHLTSLRKHMCIQHASEHLKDKPYPCPVCFHTFTNKDEVGPHLSETHSKLKCYFCQKYFQITEHLEAHLRVHTQEKPFKCQLCGQRFKTIGNLINHTNGVHKNESRRLKKRKLQDEPVEKIPRKT